MGERVERAYQPADRGGLAARELPIRRVDDPRVVLAASESRGLDSGKVRRVLGHEDAPLELEDLRVGRALEPAV